MFRSAQHDGKKQMFFLYAQNDVLLKHRNSRPKRNKIHARFVENRQFFLKKTSDVALTLLSHRKKLILRAISGLIEKHSASECNDNSLY